MNWQERLEFIRYCVKKSNDQRFVKNVKGIHNDWSLVNIIDSGERLTHQKIYYIAPEASYSGFFADHNRLLSQLFFADYFGLIPVVEYSRAYSYAEPEPVNGTDNPFEYYFKQPGGISLDEMKTFRGVLKSRKENAALAGIKYQGETGYGMSEEYIAALGKISAAYIHLREDLEETVSQSVTGILKGKRTLGVHVRGTDFKQNYIGHPVQVTAEEYLTEAGSIMKKGEYERIFLATDDLKALELFQKEFGSQLAWYQDVMRSDGTDTVMHSQLQRRQHQYLLGLEVLRDMHTLAACDGLIAGLSQVSFSARIQKKSVGKEYAHLSIINKGMNSSGKVCPK